MRWIALVVGVTLGGWMTFDGVRAIVTGDYVRVDGRLGPWADLVTAIGLDPTGGWVKAGILVLGVGWWFVVVGALIDATWWRAVAVVAAAASLWYLPFGTLLGTVVLLAALFGRIRGS